MKILAVIPARFKSSRFPGKPLVDLLGKSMIQRVYERVVDSDLFDEVIVATDDQRIFNHVKIFGKVLMTSENHDTGTDRCAEVANFFPEMEYVVNIQGDEPLVDALQLQTLINELTKENVQIATLCNPNVSQQDLENPNRIKVVLNFRNEALYFSRSAIPNTHHSDLSVKAPFFRHIGLYGFQRNTLLDLVKLQPSIIERIESLEQLRWLYYGFKIQVGFSSIETPNIDTPDDVGKVLEILKGLN